MQYLIKEAAQLAGISPTTLRYYEKAGIIHVSKNDETGYRYFNPLDINIVMKIRILREYGFTLEEIEELFRMDEAAGAVENLQRKVEEINFEIRRLECLRAKVEELSGLLTGRDDSYTIRPAMRGIFYRDVEKLSTDKELRKLISGCMKHASSILPLFEVDPDKGNHFSMGICVKETDAGEIPELAGSPYVIQIPESPCLHTIVSSCVEPDETAGCLEPAIRELQSQGITVKRKIYGRSLHSYWKDERFYVVNEFWLPLI